MAVSASRAGSGRGVEVLDSGVTRDLVGQCGVAQDLIELPKTLHNLKLTNSLVLEFSI